MEDMHFARTTDPGPTSGNITITDEEMSVQRGILGEPVVMAEPSGRPIIYGNHGRSGNPEAKSKRQLSSQTHLVLRNLKPSTRTLTRARNRSKSRL
jgi:hypothetical protein